MFDKLQPLWLPAGSIRAVLALTGWGSTIYMIIAGKEVPELWIAAVGAITVFYFAKDAVKKVIQ